MLGVSAGWFSRHRASCAGCGQRPCQCCVDGCGLGGRVLWQFCCPASVAGAFAPVVPLCFVGLGFMPLSSGSRGWFLGRCPLGASALPLCPTGRSKGLSAVPAGKVFVFFGKWLRRRLSSGQPLTFTLGSCVTSRYVWLVQYRLFKKSLHYSNSGRI